jgi:hypothetical protein
MRPGLVAAGAVLLLVAGCPQKPWMSVQGIEGEEEMVAGDSAEFRMVVSGTGPFDFRWGCTRGRLNWDERNWVIWHAPETSGTARLFAAVTDTGGRSGADTVEVRVLQASRQFLADEGAVKPGSFAAWFEPLKAGYRLQLSTQGDTGLTFMFLDSINFSEWQSGRTYDYMVRRAAYTSRPFEATVPVTGKYVAVMDNLGSARTLGFWVWGTATSP